MRLIQRCPFLNDTFPPVFLKEKNRTYCRVDIKSQPLSMDLNNYHFEYLGKMFLVVVLKKTI